MASSSGAAAVTTVLLVVLLATGWPASASGEKSIKCKDCNSTCASTINTMPPTDCGRGVCGGPEPECLRNCVSNCMAGCTAPPGFPDYCYRQCNNENTHRQCRTVLCCPSAVQCEAIINGVMQQCVSECRATCKGCGHA